LTASGSVPKTLSQKASPEGATVSSHGAALAATMASGCKRTSRKQKEKPKPSASLLLMRVGFTFCWSRGAKELLLCWDRLEKLMFDASVEPKLFMGSFVNCVKLHALMRLCFSRIFKEKRRRNNKSWNLEKVTEKS
jgi:hypothetical protein